MVPSGGIKVIAAEIPESLDATRRGYRHTLSERNKIMADTKTPSGSFKEKAEQTAGAVVDGARQMASTAAQAAEDIKTRAQEAAQAAKQTLQESVQEAMHRAGEAANDLSHQAGDTLSTAVGTASKLASKVGKRAGEAVSTVGERMHSLGSTVRERGPQSGVLRSATSAVASGLESSGDYLHEQGVSGMIEDMQSLIRRFPVQALLVGVGLGFLMARSLPHAFRR